MITSSTWVYNWDWDHLNSRVDEVLDIIGLATVSKKKKIKIFHWECGKCLAIGILSWTNLISHFDEPINGLDPSGNKEVRKLCWNSKKSRAWFVLFQPFAVRVGTNCWLFCHDEQGKSPGNFGARPTWHTRWRKISIWPPNDNLRMQDVLRKKI